MAEDRLRAVQANRPAVVRPRAEAPAPRGPRADREFRSLSAPRTSVGRDEFPRHNRALMECEVRPGTDAGAASAPVGVQGTGARERAFSRVAISPRLLTTDPVMDVQVALARAGVTMLREHRVRDEMATGALITVMEGLSTSPLGYCLYFSKRRQFE